MKTNKKWLVLVLASFLFVSCSQSYPGPGSTDSTPTESQMQMLERFLAETANAQTAVAPSPVSTAEAFTAQTVSTFVPSGLLTIIFPDGSQMGFSAAELQVLPESTVILKDQQQATGVPVLTILEQAGWSRYTVNTIAIQGVGLIKLSKAQLDGNFLLVIGNSNIRFISPLVPKADWLTEVTIIALY